MKRKKYGPILWALAVAALIVATLEGWVYYAPYSHHPLFHLLLSAQNGFKAFLFSPTITLEQMLNSLTGVSPLQQALGYAYGLAVFTAPLCTATALLLWAELAAQKLMNVWRTRKGTPILIFGWNETVRTLVNGEHADGTTQYRLHVLTSEPLSDEDELWLFRHGAVPHQMDLLSVSEERGEKLLGQLPLSRVERVLLLESSPTRNFSLYRMLTEDDSLLGPDTKYYCLCEDDGTRSVIEDAYDQRSKDCKNRAKSLTLFSLAEMKADSIFSPLRENDGSFKPLHTVNTPDRRDVHLLIAGFGSVGQQVLLQAINLGALGSQSRLYIDVVDLAANHRRDLFLNRFHSSVNACADDNELLLKAPIADGELKIRFHQLNICGRSFARLLEQLDKEMPLTYAAVCTKHADTGMHCIVELKKLTGSFPIALRLENDLLAANYLKQSDGTFKEVFPIAVSDRLLRIANICDNERETRAEQFQKTYDAIKLLKPGEEPGEKSEKASPTVPKMYQRRANILLFRHQAVKDAFGPLDPAVWERCFGEDGTILQRLSHNQYRLRHDTWADTVAAINAEPAIRELAMTEHRRWCYVMAAQGWRLAQRKDENRLETPYLTTWDTLCQEHPESAIYDLIAYLTNDER